MRNIGPYPATHISELNPDCIETTTCLKCGETIRISFDGKCKLLSQEEALARIESLDNTPAECPGYHVELGGWRKMWQLDAALERHFAKVA